MLNSFSYRIYIGKCVLLSVSCSKSVCDWMTGRKHSDSSQLTAKWNAGGDNVATRHCFYCIMRDSCIGSVYDYVIGVVAGSKACIDGYSAVQAYRTAVWANCGHI